ncbi:MAG: hypothetical protein OXC97_04105 [Candidatus Dadabacteria bacterium]|nr:hypothetical protein [Candidatus Dadabacteria bacterium]
MIGQRDNIRLLTGIKLFGLNPVIEDPKFTLKILEYFAQDDIGFPANLSANDLKAVFPEKKLQELVYHLFCCHKNDLLMLNVIESHHVNGAEYMIDLIDGLSPRGGEYFRNSQTKYWDRACEELIQLGILVTTENIIPCLNLLIRKAINAI